MSSILSLGTDYDLSCPGLAEAAESGGHWKADNGPVDFAKAFNATFEGLSLSDKQQPVNRLRCGKALLEDKAKTGEIRDCMVFFHVNCLSTTLVILSIIPFVLFYLCLCYLCMFDHTSFLLSLFYKNMQPPKF